MKHLSIAILIIAACAASTMLFFSCRSKSKEAKGKPSAEKALKHGLTPEQAARVLVKVGDTTITVGEFADRLAAQSPYLRARYQNPERRREFLDNMVEFELLALEAKNRGYDKKPEVERARKQKMVQKMMRQLFEEGEGKMSEIPEAEIQAYYDQHKDEYHKPEQVRASHILFKDKATAQRVFKEVLAAGDDMQMFRKLVEQYSQDAETRERGGDLRFFSRPEQKSADEPNVPDAVRTAAFTLKKTGEVYGSLVVSPLGLHIVKLTGKREAYDRSLEEARRSIQNRIWRERREKAIDKFVDDLRQKANVQENLALLDQVKVPPATPPGEAPTDKAPHAAAAQTRPVAAKTPAPAAP